RDLGDQKAVDRDAERREGSRRKPGRHEAGVWQHWIAGARQRGAGRVPQHSCKGFANRTRLRAREMRIDAHQHFWRLGHLEYAWMPTEPSVLRQDFLPERLAPILLRNRFEGSVVVQAATSLDETRWLLELAEANEFIRGVVGWVDLTDPGLGGVL